MQGIRPCCPFRKKSANGLSGFIATFVIGWFARELQSFTVFGFPFSFYMAAQGSLIIYVAIIWFYAYRMNKLDHEYGLHEGDD